MLYRTHTYERTIDALEEMRAIIETIRGSGGDILHGPMLYCSSRGKYLEVIDDKKENTTVDSPNN